MFVFRRPTETELAAFLARAREQSLSYSPVGLARQPQPVGFRVHEERALLGHGTDIFNRAVQGLTEWRQFDLGWAGIYPRTTPLVPGNAVAVFAGHLGFWSVHACRILYLAQDLSPNSGTGPEGGDSPPTVAGFAYGTLEDHAESGEEIFQVSMDPRTGAVTYVIRAVSRERALLAKLGFPIARALQDRFRRDSARALQRYVRIQSQPC